MLKKLALIFVVVAGLFAFQPEATPQLRWVSSTEFVISPNKQDQTVVFAEPEPERPVLFFHEPKTRRGFCTFQRKLISCQHYHSSLPVVA